MSLIEQGNTSTIVVGASISEKRTSSEIMEGETLLLAAQISTQIAEHIETDKKISQWLPWLQEKLRTASTDRPENERRLFVMLCAMKPAELLTVSVIESLCTIQADFTAFKAAIEKLLAKPGSFYRLTQFGEQTSPVVPPVPTDLPPIKIPNRNPDDSDATPMLVDSQIIVESNTSDPDQVTPIVDVTVQPINPATPVAPLNSKEHALATDVK